jgi:hypothetical protein
MPVICSACGRTSGKCESCIKVDAIIEQHESPAARVAPSAVAAEDARPAVAVVTEAMVEAYLTANDAYWKRVDGEPTTLGKWRNGTPSEATRVSLAAALAAAPHPAPAVAEPLECERCGLPPSAHDHAHWCDNQSFRYTKETGAA